MAEPKESKRAQFVRAAERKTNSVLNDLRLLRDCANASMYAWTEDDARLILAAIRTEVDRLDQAFAQGLRCQPKFRLPRSSEDSDVGRALTSDGGLEGGTRPRHNGHLERAAETQTSQHRDNAIRQLDLGIAESDILAVPVRGRERSQVEVRVTTVAEWRVLAKDKGHRLGYSLQLFGPDGKLYARRDSGKGTLRREAILLAAELIKYAANTPKWTDKSTTVAA